ncbi:protein-s-isoprenylcysteine O-methyltransferase [Sistotremastrum niveocremeum HHB9708]|uniref:Protein-S-isoprenylcysteine O-methyltransferase n=2 Tax=Sistotremastraceae TaxID=3402574 RepID=A0A164ZEN7_9AGAM|nr:protein-s-isoprenylcysteine O-methyltransferase [Sistotremastrum niveocremeum HHB9708]KZT41188.1 ICMT-domain-containing protein [Sistotremastrum suecicum HHB10207 ss-3]
MTARPTRGLETNPSNSEFAPNELIPNTPLAASLISFILGGIFSLGAATYFLDVNKWWWCTSQLGFFLAAWAAFHWGEFAVTAGWNRDKCSIDSFLLDNGWLYHAAHGCALTEYILTLYFRPSWKTFPYYSFIGVLLVIVGQTLRSSAMIHASTNFSHQVQFRKAVDHTLVTSGVYAWFRHPSYAGFFYWGLGTQLVLQNPICFLLYAALLWRFFSRRIRAEEYALIKFFGDDYKQYRKAVGTRIPFIP